MCISFCYILWYLFTLMLISSADINSKLDQMIKQGILKEVNEQTNWISSFVAVKTPGKLRICIDPKDLNKALKHNHYIKTLDDILHNLAKVKVFSVLDAKDS